MNLYEHEDDEVHLTKWTGKYTIICSNKDIKMANRQRNKTRCKICFGPVQIQYSNKTIPFNELFSWNIQQKRWQRTSNITARVNMRLMEKIYESGKTPIVKIDNRTYYYLGLYSSYDDWRQKELKEFFLFQDTEKGNYDLRRNINIERVTEIDSIDFDLQELKTKIRKECKTYDDELRMSYIFNLNQC